MVASVGPRGARKRCERWELVKGSFVGSRARAHDSASFGEFSDIDADVLGVKRGGQECPPYIRRPRFCSGAGRGHPAYVCVGSVMTRFGTWAC